MKLSRVIPLIFLIYLAEVFGRRIRDFADYDSISNEIFDDEYDYELDDDRGKAAVYDDITCTKTSYCKALSNLFEVNDKILVITKYDLVADAIEIKMFSQLQIRFHGRGYKDLQFIVYYENSTNDMESDEILENLIIINQNKSVYNYEFDIEPKHVYIMDECTRLTYIIVPPWSSTEYPYVKAAILSTIYDQPCGACNLYSTTTLRPNTSSNHPETTSLPFKDDVSLQINYAKEIEEIEEFFKNSSELFGNQTDSENEDFVLPMTIRIPMLHVHLEENQTYSKYDEVVLLSDNQEYHEHTSSILETLRHLDVPLNVSLSELTFQGHNLTDILETAETKNHSQILQSNTGRFYLILKHFNFTPYLHYDEIKFLEMDIKQVKFEPPAKKKDSKKHYERLKEWLTWQFI